MAPTGAVGADTGSRNGTATVGGGAYCGVLARGNAPGASIGYSTTATDGSMSIKVCVPFSGRRTAPRPRGALALRVAGPTVPAVEEYDEGNADGGNAAGAAEGNADATAPVNDTDGGPIAAPR